MGFTLLREHRETPELDSGPPARLVILPLISPLFLREIKIAADSRNHTAMPKKPKKAKSNEINIEPVIWHLAGCRVPGARAGKYDQPH